MRMQHIRTVPAVTKAYFSAMRISKSEMIMRKAPLKNERTLGNAFHRVGRRSLAICRNLGEDHGRLRSLHWTVTVLPGRALRVITLVRVQSRVQHGSLLQVFFPHSIKISHVVGITATRSCLCLSFSKISVCGLFLVWSIEEWCLVLEFDDHNNRLWVTTKCPRACGATYGYNKPAFFNVCFSDGSEPSLRGGWLDLRGHIEKWDPCHKRHNATSVRPLAYFSFCISVNHLCKSRPTNSISGFSESKTHRMVDSEFILLLAAMLKTTRLQEAIGTHVTHMQNILLPAQFNEGLFLNTTTELVWELRNQKWSKTLVFLVDPNFNII